MTNIGGRQRSLLQILFLALVATGSAVAQDARTRERDPGWVAPAKNASTTNPLANRPEAAAGGRKLFQQRCSTCHGDQGQGTAKAPDLVTADVQAQSDGALFWKISGGNAHTGMPAFSFLPEPQRWQLVLHIRALGTGATPSS